MNIFKWSCQIELNNRNVFNMLNEWSRWQTCKNYGSFGIGDNICIVNKFEVVSKNIRLNRFNGCNFVLDLRSIIVSWATTTMFTALFS
jgi:hypothetical protein